MEDGAAARTIYLVVFEEPASRPRLVPRVDPGVPDEMPEEPAHKIRRLTNELGSTRDFLQSVIEQQEASNEDLQSANEEVQSTNEELQSINEELETSKEEILSLIHI